MAFSTDNIGKNCYINISEDENIEDSLYGTIIGYYKDTDKNEEYYFVSINGNVKRIYDDSLVNIVDDGGGGSVTPGTLIMVSGEMTEEQATQFRENIGAVSIDDIGTVFVLKGSVDTVADLPTSGNHVGDVYYVQDVSAGYIWLISDSQPNGYWEELGETFNVTVDSELSNTSENPVQNKVINAALAMKGTYSKPNGGIPKSDFTSNVQMSLEKADTALQSVPTTYRTAAAQDLIDDAQNAEISKKLDADTLYKSQLLHKLQQARFAANPVTLLHFSDLHDDAAALSRITTEATELGELVDDVICTGDTVAGSARYYQADGVTIDTSKPHGGSEGADFANWWEPSVLTVIGNHDAAHQISGSGLVWNAVSMADKAAFYLDPFASSWGVTRPESATYYYKDYKAKLRLIALDTTLTGQDMTDQMSWLAARLADAVANDLHVLIAAHSPAWGADLIQSSWSDVRAKDPYPTTWDEKLPQSVVDAVAAAQESGLKFAGYLVGHQHKDGLYDVTGDKSQMAFAVTTANTYARVQWKDADQWRSNSGNDAYNLVTVDTDRNLVKLVRAGGADMDNLLRTRDVLVWDYGNRRDVNSLALAEAVSGLHGTVDMTVTYDDNSTETFRLWRD